MLYILLANDDLRVFAVYPFKSLDIQRLIFVFYDLYAAVQSAELRHDMRRRILQIERLHLKLIDET